jgi:YidC/Oxa1 family membrane protein insertase
VNPIDFLSNEVMLPVLNAFYGITHSYGVAIILLTLAVKAALFPLTAKQFKASRQMQQLQPKLQELQAKYKNNPEEMQRRLMEFYKENNANPFSSCLPTLIQLPFIFALYAALMSETFRKEIAHTGFLFISDLANSGIFTKAGTHWDNLILVAIFGVSTWAMQKMMTTNPDDPMQRQMLFMMPIMITGMFLFFPLPSGVLLYIVASNLITLAQNAVLMKQMPLPARPSTPASQAVIETQAQSFSGGDGTAKESRASKRQRLREAARKKEK